MSPECPDTKSGGMRKIETPRGSCTNSIISSDSMVSDSFDSKNFVTKNSESEIGKNCIDVLFTPRKKYFVLYFAFFMY